MVEDYKLTHLVVKFAVSKELTQDKRISYLKYRVNNPNQKKDFEGYFDMKES